MGLSKTSILVLSIAAVMCITGTVVNAAALAPPSTDGWTLTPVIDGNFIQLLLGIDNSASLASYDGAVSKTWGDPTLMDSSKFIALGDSGALLRSLTLTLDGDPKVSLKFDVLAGSTDTAFVIPLIANTLSFSPINVKGTATAAITVTDNEDNGAKVTGGYSDGSFYKADYNSLNFCHLIYGPIIGSAGPIIAAPYSSNVGNGNVLPWQPISGLVSSISSEFAFTLSANDSASGTSNFTVLPVPEPGSMLAMFTGIVGMAGFALRRRKA